MLTNGLNSLKKTKSGLKTKSVPDDHLPLPTKVTSNGWKTINNSGPYWRCWNFRRISQQYSKRYCVPEARESLICTKNLQFLWKRASRENMRGDIWVSIVHATHYYGRWVYAYKTETSDLPSEYRVKGELRPKKKRQSRSKIMMMGHLKENDGRHCMWNEFPKQWKYVNVRNLYWTEAKLAKLSRRQLSWHEKTTWNNSQLMYVARWEPCLEMAQNIL